MRTWKPILPIVLFFALTAWVGLNACGDEDAPANACPDNDGDGYGLSASPSCKHSELDCDDSEPDVYPGALELCDDIDNQCPGDPGHGIVDEGFCDFHGGSFLFTIKAVEDTCLGGSLQTSFPQDQEFGPVQLPGLGELPATIEIPFGPPVGEVSAILSQEGDVLSIHETDAIEMEIPDDFGSVTATMSGGITPVTGSYVMAIFTFHVTAAPASVDMPCDVRIGSTGELQ